MADYQPARFKFGPRPNDGILLGLRLPQLVGFSLFGFAAEQMLRVHGAGGLLAGIALVVLAVVIFAFPVYGRTIDQWAPITVRFFLASFTGQRRFRSQVGQLGHIVGLPSGDLDPQPVHEPKSAPLELADLELLEVTLETFNRAPMGAVKDKRAKTYTAVLACQGAAFDLLDPMEQDARLADYGGALAALARDGSPIRRISWYERTVPGDRDALGSYLVENMRPEITLDSDRPEFLSYLKLLGGTSEANHDHELLFAIQVDAARASARKAIVRMGKGDLGAMAVLAAEVDHVVRLLEEASISVKGVLTRRGIAAAIRDGYDPWGRQQRERGSDRGPFEPRNGVAPVSAGPLARDEHWSHISVDGGLHCTFWIAEWPRIDVRALFMQPLLVTSHLTRTVAMVMEIVGPDRAIRSAEKASTEAATNQSLRDRVGQRTTRRQEQREAATAERERELTEGHAAIRFTGYASVSVANNGDSTINDLERVVTQIELHAKQAGLRLDRLSGQQAEAFTFVLPLCRGLK
jgi:hypothetical protein